MTDRTATCPPAPVIVDRSFYQDEPLCLATLEEFEFKEGDVWAGLALQGKGATETLEICLAEVRGWVETEKSQRGLTDE